MTGIEFIEAVVATIENASNPEVLPFGAQGIYLNHGRPHELNFNDPNPTYRTMVYVGEPILSQGAVRQHGQVEYNYTVDIYFLQKNQLDATPQQIRLVIEGMRFLSRQFILNMNAAKDSNGRRLLKGYVNQHRTTERYNLFDLNVSGVMISITFTPSEDLAYCTSGTIKPCADATCFVSYDNGTLIATRTIPSGGKSTVLVPNPGTGLPGTGNAINSLGTVLASGSVPSGGSANIPVPDIEFTDSDGSTYNVPAGVNVIATSCPPSPTCDPASWKLENTDGTQLDTGSIASGGVQVIVAPDGEVELNGTPVGSVVSRGVLDVTVTQGGNPVAGTFNGTSYEVPPCPVLSVDFSVDDTTPVTNQIVTFTSNAPGAIEYLWSFGDGNASSAANPTHQYRYPGTYTVTLWASDGTIEGREVKTNYIVVTLQSVLATGRQAWWQAPQGATPSNLTLVSGAVSNWVDAHSGYNKAQGVVSARPIYVSNGMNGFGYLSFNGSTHFILNNSPALTRTTGSFEAILMRRTAYKAASSVFIEAGTTGNLYEVFADTNQANYGLFNGALSTQRTGYPVGAWIVLFIHWNGASSFIEICDVARWSVTNNIGAGSSTGSTNGATATGVFNAAIDVVEHIIYTAKPSDAEIIEMGNYFKSKFGLW